MGEQRRTPYERLVERFGDRGEALYVFAAGLVAMAVSGLLAIVLAQPLIFPSLGPTVYLFFESPTAATSSPRSCAG